MPSPLQVLGAAERRDGENRREEDSPSCRHLTGFPRGISESRLHKHLRRESFRPPWGTQVAPLEGPHSELELSLRCLWLLFGLLGSRVNETLKLEIS